MLKALEGKESPLSSMSRVQQELRIRVGKGAQNSWGFQSDDQIWGEQQESRNDGWY